MKLAEQPKSTCFTARFKLSYRALSSGSPSSHDRSWKAGLIAFHQQRPRADVRRSTAPAHHCGIGMCGNRNVDILAGMAIARLPLIAIDCPDPGALARFYGAMLDWTIDISVDRASVRPEDGQCIAFHRVPDYTPPTWPPKSGRSRCTSTCSLTTSTQPRRQSSIWVQPSIRISPVRRTGSSWTLQVTLSAFA